MLGNFDPYHQWLGIPPEEQPANLYRLLDIADKESDAKVIRRAASQRTEHVKAIRTQENAIFADLMIKEINEAGKILLDPGKKKAYDSQLKPSPPRSTPPAAAAAGDSEIFSDPLSSGSVVGHSDIHSGIGRSGVHAAAGGRSGIDASASRSGVQAAASRSGVRGESAVGKKKPASSLPGWFWLAVGGAGGFLAIAAVVLLFVVFMRGPKNNGTGDGKTVAQQGAKDTGDSTGNSSGKGKKVLPIEPVADVSVAPGTLLRIPIVIPGQPVGTKCKVASGPAGASMLDSKNMFEWQTSAAHAGGEHKVTVTADHQDFDTAEMTFTVSIGGADEPVTLIDLVDVQRDAVQGEWQVEDGALLSPNAPDQPRIEVPFAPPESYDLSFEVEKFEGAKGLHVGLASGPARWSVYLDGPMGSGLAHLDGKDYHVNVTTYRDTVIREEETSSFRCRVRPSQVQVVCNGKTIINFRGDLGSLSAPDQWSVPHANALSFGADEASYRILNAVLTPVAAASSDPAHQLSDEIAGVEEFEGHHYRAYFDQVPWAEASRRCEQLGGHLACINDGLEQSYVAGLRDRTQVWLGGVNPQNKQLWKWADNSLFKFDNWLPNRPDDRGVSDTYLAMTASGGWDDEAGNVELGYVCEWDAAPGTERAVQPPPDVVAVTPTPDVSQATQIQRIAVPPRTEVETFATQFRGYLARQPLETREKRVTFVRQMIHLAKDREKKPIERYVRLIESQRYAAEHGDADLAVEAIDVLAEQFDMDPLPRKQQAVVKAFQASSTPEQAETAKDHLTQVINDALENDACDLAMQAARVAYNETLKPAKKKFRPEFFELRKNVEPQYEDWQKFAKFEEDLEKNPDDPQANLEVGKRYCFRRGNWEDGLKRLANSGDPGLRALAEAELADPQTAAERAKLADAWWNAAASEDDAAGKAVYDHAGNWYEKAKADAGEADEDLLARIDDRLEQLAKMEEATATEEAPLDEPPLEFNFEKLGLFDGRSGETRRLLLKARGGNAESEAAVATALEWLAKHQMSDGGWSFDHAVATGGVGTNGGNMPQARNAATGIVLLAFLGAGQTHKSGTYREKVEQGIRFLGKRAKVQKDGRSASFNEEGGTMYSHGIATQALCEAYAMTQDKALFEPCRLALAYTINSQHPMTGGWRYKPKEKGDTSVTGWQLTALKLGSEAGLKPPSTALALTGRFLDSVQYDGGAKYGYQGPGGTDATSAIGLLCRMYLGWPRDHAALGRGVDQMARYNSKDKIMYLNYHVTQVLQHYGGQPWDAWNESMQTFLLERQAKQGPAAGSWWISGKHAGEGGRLCCTALATLMLESYYRYLPVYPETRREISRRLTALEADE